MHKRWSWIEFPSIPFLAFTAMLRPATPVAQKAFNNITCYHTQLICRLYLARPTSARHINTEAKSTKSDAANFKKKSTASIHSITPASLAVDALLFPNSKVAKSEQIDQIMTRLSKSEDDDSIDQNSASWRAVHAVLSCNDDLAVQLYQDSINSPKANHLNSMAHDSILSLHLKPLALKLPFSVSRRKIWSYLTEMRNQNVSPTIETFNSMLLLFGRGHKDAKAVLSICSKIGAHQLELNNRTMAIMIDAFAECGVDQARFENLLHTYKSSRDNIPMGRNAEMVAAVCKYWVMTQKPMAAIRAVLRFKSSGGVVLNSACIRWILQACLNVPHDNLAHLQVLQPLIYKAIIIRSDVESMDDSLKELVRACCSIGPTGLKMAIRCFTADYPDSLEFKSAISDIAIYVAYLCGTAVDTEKANMVFAMFPERDDLKIAFNDGKAKHGR